MRWQCQYWLRTPAYALYNAGLFDDFNKAACQGGGAPRLIVTDVHDRELIPAQTRDLVFLPQAFFQP